MIGVIGLSLFPMSNPRSLIDFLKCLVCLQSVWTRSGSFSRTSIAAMHAATTAGGCEPLRSQVLDLLYAKLVRSREPEMCPPTTPKAFENVPISIWTCFLSR